MKLLRGALALPALFALGALAPAANATVELKLSDGTTNIDIIDGAVGDGCAAAGCVTYSGAVGGFVVNVTTGTSNFTDLLDLNSVDIAAPGAGTLTIQLSDNGYSPASNGFKFSIGGTLTGGGTLTAKAFGGNSNTKFDTSHQLGSTLSFTTSPFSGLTFGSVAGVSPYSATIVTTLNFVGAGQTSYDAAIDPVPEPGSVALLGGVLLLTAGAIRRKVRRA